MNRGAWKIFFTILTICLIATDLHIANAAKSDLQQGADYVEAKMWSDAVQSLNKSIRIDPKSPRAHYLLGFSYLNLAKTSHYSPVNY
jgi:Tfp pilus assembly protein PilF